MTEQNRRSISPDEIATLLPSSSASSAATESSTTKQRRKRKWDQPDESLFPSAVSIPGILPSVTMSSMGGILLPAVAPASAALLTNFVAASNTNISQLIQAPMAHNEVAALVLKQTQSKIQDELIIAREIVINDADAAVRYKLTKRQTQEEIQKSTGAVVITRGKYRPPNSVPDGEKPLYLHISAGAHLKETAERIIAVDLAAAMVEEMRKQDQNVPLTSSINSTAGGVKVSQPLSTCVYLGFDADPSVDIAARIRGPNDQYINHIMNETGASVLLRGQGSGIHGSTTEGQQPLHLFLSCIDPKGLEDARLLADNLLDTISWECGSTRVMSGRAYSAVPPPPNLLDGVHSSRNEPKSNLSLSPSPASSVSSPIASAIVSAPGLMTAVSYGPFAQPGRLLNASQLQPNGISYPRPSLSSGTSYSGYGGIYPQATPLQQVALALRHSNTVTPATAAMISATPLQKSTDGSSEKKQVHQKRKFQESPATLRGAAASQQGSETMDLGISSSGIPTGRVSFLPPKKFAGSASTSMPPPPPRNSTMLLPPPKNDTMPPPPPKNDTMPPPPPRNGTMPPPLPRSGPMPRPPPRNGPTMPPPSPRSLTEPLPALKFCSLTSVHEESGKVSVPNKLKPENVPDTLSQIMEYGEDDDEEEDDESDVRISLGKSTKPGAPKPF